MVSFATVALGQSKGPMSRHFAGTVSSAGNVTDYYQYRYYSPSQRASMIGIAILSGGRPSPSELCETRAWDALTPKQAPLSRIAATLETGTGGHFRLRRRAPLDSAELLSPEYAPERTNDVSRPAGDTVFTAVSIPDEPDLEREWPKYFARLPRPEHGPIGSEMDAQDLKAASIRKEDINAYQDLPSGKMNLEDVEVLLRTRDVPAVKAYLAKEGDGARLLNEALASCGSPTFQTNLLVPPHMEAWYAGKFVQQGLAISATPTFREDIGDISIGIPDRALITKFYAPTVPEHEKVGAVGEYLRKAILSFAVARRPDFARKGTVQALPTRMRNIWSFEVTGPSLVGCSLNTWEKLQFDITYVGGDGKNTLEVGFDVSEGSPGPPVTGGSGPNLNKIERDNLTRFDDLVDGYLLAQGFKETDSTQAGKLTDVVCKMGRG